MNRAFILIGVVLGIVSFFSPGSLFFFFIFFLSLIFLNRLSDKEEKRFVTVIFSSAFILRVMFVLLLSFLAISGGRILNYTLTFNCPNYSTPYIFGDAGYYTLRALFTKMYWLGEPISSAAIREYVTISYGFSGFITVLALFYSLLGYSPVSSQLLNCLLGALIAVVIYAIVKNIFAGRPARLAAVMAAFFPSLFLWSVSNLKEPATILLACILLWSMIKYNITRKFYYLVVAALSVAGHVYIRPSFSMEFIFITVFLILCCVFYPYFLLFFKKIPLIGFLLLIMIISAFAAALPFFGKEIMGMIIKKTYIVHKGVVNTGGICYRLLPDYYYSNPLVPNFLDFMKMFVKGWFHTIFEPLPNRIFASRTILFSLPQMFLWYFMIPFSLLGMAIAIRYRLKESIFPIIYFIIMTSALALSGGNVGTLFRTRDEVVTVIFIIFGSIGLIKVFGRGTLLSDK